MADNVIFISPMLGHNEKTRVCSRCHVRSPLATFWVCNTRNGRAGRDRVCGECRRSMKRIAYKNLTDDQWERHKEACRVRYVGYKRADPFFLQQQWETRRQALIERGEWPAEVVRQRIAYKRYYARDRHRLLQPDKSKREELIAILGGKCVHCGYAHDVRALVLDHKDGRGDLDRKRVGTRIARYYINHIDEALDRLQVLCANCNTIKAMEEKEHNRSRRLPQEAAYG
jgi:hypothetical protein